MTCKLTRNISVVRGIALFIAFLMVLIVMVAFAQTNGAGKQSIEQYVASVTADTVLSPSRLSAAESEVLGHAPKLFKLSGTYGSGGQYASGMAMADVNGDGKPDLLVSNICASNSNCTQGQAINNGTVGVLLDNGDGTFKTVVPYYAGGFFARSVAVADVNGDSKPDVLVAICADEICHDHSVGVLLGSGNGTFLQAVVYSLGVPVSGPIAVADVNGDKKSDLVVGNINGVGVLLGNGDGTFQIVVNYELPGGEAGGPVAIADLNADGKPDLLVSNFFGVAVLLGNGDGTFQSAVVYGSGGDFPGAVAVADLNGDGKPDVVVSNSCSENGCVKSTVGVLLGNGDGTFRPAVSYLSGGNAANSVAVGDMNADSKPDVVVVNLCDYANPCANGRVGVLSGNGDGTFQSAVPYQSGGTMTGSVAVGDVNGDGRLDLLVTSKCVSLSDCTNGVVGVLLGIRVPTHTLVTTSGSPTFVNQPVTFTATVFSRYGSIPDGDQVTFYDGTTAMGTGSTTSGISTFTTSSLSAKSHTIKATYTGDAVLLPSTGTITQIVNKYSTTTALTSNPNPSQFGQAVVFTAQVASTGPLPTGKVKFLDGATTLGSATLSGGVAKLTKSTLAVGTHSITVQYLGDAVSDKSTSPVVNQLVQ